MIAPILIVIFLFILGSVAYLKSRSLISPFVIVPVLWGGIISFFYIVPNDLFPLGSQFFICITIWCTCFWLGGLLVDSSPVHQLRIQKNDASERVRKIYFYICLLATPLICYSLYRAASNGPSELFFINLREINTGNGESDFSLGPLAYVFSIAFIALMVELIEEKGKRVFTSRVTILFVINIILAVLTVGRTSFFYLFVGMLIVLNSRGLIKMKHFVIFIGFITSLFLLITLLRSSDDGSDAGELIANTIKIYIFSGLPAFQTLEYNAEVTQFGGNLFRFFYAVASSLGFDVEVKKTIYEYAYVPYPTNVYTVMYPFFTDFGTLGVSIGAFLYGCFYQLWYKVSIAGVKVAQVFFCFLFTSLVLQFFGEYILTNLSSAIQYLILAYLPYAARKQTS